MLDRFWHDPRHAARLLIRTPLFTVTAILSLAIGIGANATIFTVANALLLTPIAGVAAPDRVVDIGASRHGVGLDTVSYSTYADLRDRTKTLAGLYAIRPEPGAMSFGDASGALRVYGQSVSANFFDVLGVVPAAGTFFQAAEEHLGVPLRKIVLSHAFWQRQFAGDRTVIGRGVVINGDPYVVAGVAPPGFQGTSVLAPDMWVPLTAYGAAMPSDQLLRSRNSLWLLLGGRLKPGVAITQARDELSALHTAMAKEFPDAYRNMAIVVAPVSRVPGQVGDAVVPVIGLLMSVVGLVLLIACANLASLLLARAASRSREMAVRLALGARRSDVIVQCLTESLLLFLVGGAAGLLLARGMTRALWSMLPALPVQVDISLSLDWRVVCFTAGLALVTGVITGLAPAIQSSRADLVSSIKAGESAPARQRLRHLFVAVQMGLCLLLIVIAGLFLRAVGAAAHVDPGFRVAGVDVASVDLAIGGYAPDQSALVTEQLRERLAAAPGVAAVAAAAVVPLEGSGLGLGELRVPGADKGLDVDVDWNVISPEFLPALGLPIVRGRNFTAADRDSAPVVAIVNERFAAHVWPGEDPIGKVLETGGFGPKAKKGDVRRMTIVGVARDAKYRWIGDRPRPFIYVAVAQQTWQRVNLFLVRDARLGASVDLAPTVRQALRQFNPNLPLTRVMPLKDYADLGMLPQRLAASVAGSLGIVALLLAAIGIYGVTAYAVTTRTREIGIRMAIGADRRDVMRLVLTQGLRLTLIGGGAGLVLAGLAAFGLASQQMLFGIAAIDPAAFGLTTAALVTVAIAASYVPARRAASIDPLVALRAE